MEKNVELSQQAAALIGARPNECFNNGRRLMGREEYCRATYVEGAVFMKGLRQPEPHCWVVLDGEIIDPTLPEMDVPYFPAISLTGIDYLTAITHRPDKPLYNAHPHEKEMDVARNAAWAWRDSLPAS